MIKILRGGDYEEHQISGCSHYQQSHMVSEHITAGEEAQQRLFFLRKLKLARLCSQLQAKHNSEHPVSESLCVLTPQTETETTHASGKRDRTNNTRTNRLKNNKHTHPDNQEFLYIFYFYYFGAFKKQKATFTPCCWLTLTKQTFGLVLKGMQSSVT